MDKDKGKDNIRDQNGKLNKDKIIKQHSALFTEFEKWKPLFREVRDYLFPWLGFFADEQTNDGTRKDEYFLRTISIEYANILAAGMQWGITSPTRPWVKYRLQDYQLMQQEEVRRWLEIRRDIVLDVLDRSNFYPANHQFYLELGIFNTAAMLIEEDDETGINCRTFTIGEFAVGLDKKGRPNQFARNIRMTAWQLVEQFGIDNVPDNVRRQYNDGHNDGDFKVYHLICPNRNYRARSLDRDHMKFSDYYWMDGMDEKFLRKGGFNEFPVMVERWQTRGADTYGTGPGIWSLGDAKQIQLMWENINSAVELGTKPPMQAPVDIYKNGGINLYPAGANYFNPNTGGPPIQPLFNVNLNIDHASRVQAEIETCIRKNFKVDVFNLISEISMGKGARTAREIIELTAEKMSQMGPLLERLQTGYLPQVIERVDSICERLGLFPPPPPEIEGIEIKVEYVSVLSQAQKQNLITPILDTVSSVIDIAQTTQMPEVLDKLNFDKVTDNLGLLNGIPEEIINSDEIATQIRQARAEQQAMANAAAMGQTAAQIAKTASQADLSGDNALTQVLGGPVEGVQL